MDNFNQLLDNCPSQATKFLDFMGSAHPNCNILEISTIEQLGCFLDYIDSVKSQWETKLVIPKDITKSLIEFLYEGVFQTFYYLEAQNNE